MFAVIKTGGKQYQVKEGEVLTVEKLPQKSGDKIVFDKVLLIGGEEIKIGQPLVSGAKVEAEILEQKRGPKVTIIKYKPKTRYHRKRGHRQSLTKIKILKIIKSS